MTERYAIAIFNREEEYILKPFLANPPTIDRLVIITGKHIQDDCRYRITSFLGMMNVSAEFSYVEDITNFFQIFFIIRKMCTVYGRPEWVNISCGSGIGMAALAIHAVNENIPMVAYEKDLNKSFVVNVRKLRKINIFDGKYFNLMEDIANGYDTIGKLSEINHIDKSIVSRRLKVLASVDLIERKEEGRKYPFRFHLSEFGKSLLGNSI